MTIHIRHWALPRLLLFLVLELAAMLVGIFSGRAIIRGLLSIVLPPKARQHLSFLWLVDGKKLRIDPSLA